jgi:hypothetical protein
MTVMKVVDSCSNVNVACVGVSAMNYLVHIMKALLCPLEDAMIRYIYN